MNNTTDVEMAGIDSDKTIVVNIKHDDKLPENSECHFQAALLYTTAAGERRIRVHTLSVRTAKELTEGNPC